MEKETELATAIKRLEKLKKWIVEVPDGLYSVDGDLEKYLNTNPHPGYTLSQAILRGGGSESIYVLIWKRKV